MCLLPSLLERRLLHHDRVLLEVRGHLPLVGGLRLGDVDECEVGAVAEALVEALDVARPATKRRSGEAAEDEQQRPPAVELGHGDRLEIVGSSYGDGRKWIAGL